jgi:hypothetical protein
MFEFRVSSFTYITPLALALIPPLIAVTSLRVLRGQQQERTK